MNRILCLVLALLSAGICNAQEVLKISYVRSFNGKVPENQDTIVVFCAEKMTFLTSGGILSKAADFPFEQTVVERGNNWLVQYAQLSATSEVRTIDSTALPKQRFEMTQETKEILGYQCKKAKTVVNSNTIELWFTSDANVKGAPSALGQNLGLVLETVRNGNSAVSAVKVEKVATMPTFSQEIPMTVDNLSYKDLLWRSRFTTIPVFNDEQIHFSDSAKSSDSVMRFANGTIIVRKVRFPAIDSTSQIFVDLTEQSNGDAYDRTGSIFMIPVSEKKTLMDALKSGVQSLPMYENGNGKKYQGVVLSENFIPLIELVRFFTPFGIKQYNTLELKGKKWHEIVPYRQEITEIAPLISGKEVWLGVFIGNYDKGGHRVSMNVTIHKDGLESKGNSFALPLFNTVNIMEMAGQEYGTMFSSDKGLLVHFTLEHDVKNAKLRYITTGHGGWGNGDEFVQKKNTIFLDDKEIFSFIPWRQDCGSYRLYNPASGNFPNGLSSSDLSRSNWCPGTITPPNSIELGDLKAGKHSVRIKIPLGAPEGNRFSAWNVSGIIIGE